MDTTTSERTISGMGRLVGDLPFRITISNDASSVEEVCDQLNSGEIHLYFEDTELFDEGGKIIGKVTWSEDKGNFVVRAADPTEHCSLPNTRDPD